jgi:hypothetical protein
MKFENKAISFERRGDSARSAQLLRTCKQVAEEGTVVLYGENSFHFGRCTDSRGTFWERQWKEVGYRDIRRFLTMIGPDNVSKLKYLSFCLTDGYLNRSKYLVSEYPRFVNDPILQQALKVIGKNAYLLKLGITFAGRAKVYARDYQ